MADVKITELGELNATPADADIIEIVDDVIGSPVSKFITIANLHAALAALNGAAFTAFPTTPAQAPIADYEVSNKKYVDDSAAGEVATDAIWDAAGDLVYGTGANTGARLAAGQTTQILVGGGAGAPVWTAAEGSGAPVREGSPSLITPNIGIPTAGTLTNCTGLPIGSGVSGLGANVDTFLATPSSANLIAALTDETGSGAAVFATSPTLVTPALGTPASGTLSGCDAGTTGALGVLLLASAAEVATGTDTAKAITAAGVAAVYQYQTLYIDALAMIACVTNPAEASSEEYETNDIDLDFKAFDGGATEERVQFNLVMPEAWDRGAVKAIFHWSSAASSTTGDTVEWGIKAGALADSDAIDTALGDPQVITDTLLADNGTDWQISNATPAMTIAGTPGLGEMVIFEIYRNTDGTDDMAEDAWLFGVTIQFKVTNEVSVW